MLSVLPIAACENWHSIYRTADLDGGDSLITDAKQRVVTNVADFRREGHRIVCAEPSPDVAQAIQAAVQASANVSNGQTQVGGQFGYAVAAQVAQLGERLAAIQLLRDKMYRACEAYANGAMRQAGYISLIARIDKTMATMLSSEMAAGAFGRNQALLQGSASAQSSVDPNAIKQAQDTLATSLADLSKAKDAFAAATAADDQKTKATAVTSAAEKVNLAAAAVLNLEKATAVNAGSSGAGSTAGGKIDRTGALGDASAVVTIHRNFIDDDGIDGLIDACVVELAQMRYADEDYVLLSRLAADRPGYKSSKSGTVNASETPESKWVAAREGSFFKNRLDFAEFCKSDVIGASKGSISPFIQERQRAKERLRLMAENTALAQQCFPIMSGGVPKSEPRKSQYEFCLNAVRRATR